jgi:hypothetical protein
MIDMRGEGVVQHDGFEYNWFFRRGKWSPEVGTLSAGGWVRRRRWVRLMVRPAVKRPTSSAPNTPNPQGTVAPPSVPESQSSGASSAIGEVWQGDVAADWERCKALMRRVGRDGRRLELWRTWLSAYLPMEGTKLPRPKQWTEDSVMMPSEADYAAIQHTKEPIDINKQAISEVIRAHVRHGLLSSVDNSRLIS